MTVGLLTGESARLSLDYCSDIFDSIQTEQRTRIMNKAKESPAGSAVATGLRGVVAASSSIGDVDGEKGELIYQGINIHDLAAKSTFEEVVFLLWDGRLPKRAELDELKKNLAASYDLPKEIVELIKGMYARV